MDRLLKFEFRKLRSQKVFYISLAIIFGYTLVSALIAKFTYDLAAQLAAEEGFIMPAISSAEQIMNAANGGLLTLLLAIAVPIIVTEDFDQGIIKNIYAKGFSRGSVYFAKLIYAAACATALFAAQILCTTFSFGIIYGFEWVGWKGFGLLWAQYLAYLATFAFYFTISASFKKVGSSIAINIFIPSVIGLLLNLISLALAKEDFSLANYWIAALLPDLSEFAVTGERILECIIASVVYIGAFITGGYFINRNTEV